MTDVIITLPDELTSQLYELADMYGIEGSINDIAMEILDRAIQSQYDLTADTPIIDSSNLSSRITAAVANLIDFDPSVEVEFISMPEHQKADVKLTFDDIKRISVDDKLVSDIANSNNQSERDALTALYNEIPKDIWGTIKARELFVRQLKFSKCK